MLSSGELIIIFLIAFLVFGPERLPELGKTLGKWLYEIRKGIHDATAEIENEMHEIDKKQKNDTDNSLAEGGKNSSNETNPEKVKSKG
jgi:TatA/E family protein of Tat protein translocase